jgi:hypothetical protein
MSRIFDASASPVTQRASYEIETITMYHLLFRPDLAIAKLKGYPPPQGRGELKTPKYSTAP